MRWRRVVTLLLLAVVPFGGNIRGEGNPGGESIPQLARRVAGESGPAVDRARRLIRWSQTELAWTATDYRKRTPEEVIERRGGNCAELASVLAVLLKAIDLPVRWIAEINVQPKSPERQANAEAKVREMGPRASIFGLRHNDHRWLEVYDAATASWFPADPAVGVAGIREWEAARLGFGERPRPAIAAVAEVTRDMLVPFAVMTLAPDRRTVEADRSAYYLVEQFDRFYDGRLSSLPAWPAWVAQVGELSAASRAAFSGAADLHRSTEHIAALEATYRQLEAQAKAKGITPASRQAGHAPAVVEPRSSIRSQRE